MKWPNDYPPETVVSVALLLDGHSILPKSELIDHGMPEDAAAEVSRTHYSGTHPKEMIFTQDGKVDSLEGAYGLEVLVDIVSALELGYTKSLGRGFRARECQKMIIEWAKERGITPEQIEGIIKRG